MDAFTTSASYPYARHYRLGRDRINYMRNSVKVMIDAYDGSTSFYVVDNADPIIAAYRGLFPSLFKDLSAMPPELRAAHALSGAAAAAAGRCLRALPHDGSRRLLQPRGSLGDRHRGRAQRAARAGRADDGAELRADEAAGRAGARVHRDPAVHAGQPQQPDWLDRRPRRRAALRQGGRLPLSRRRGWSTARCRSRRASIRTRSSRASCRCGTSRDRRWCAAA